MGIFLSLGLSTEAVAKKKNTNNGALTVINNKGEKVLNGSVLDSTEDQMFIALHSVLVSTLRGDLNNVSIILSSIADPSKKFLISKDAVKLQNRKVNKKNGKFLSVNLFNVKTQSGVTIPPSALQTDNYKLRIVSNMLDVSTESFSYRTPTLVVGMVSQKNSGFVVVEDLLGNKISNSIVTLTPNGSFFTEVRADMVKPVNNRNPLRSSLKNQVAEDDLSVGVIHVISDTDLFAITPLDNDPEINGAQADEPLIVNESTTLTANLAKQDEELALEVAKKELENLQSNTGDDTEFGDLNCDINQFADRCDTEDEEAAASLGNDVKNLISNPQCNLPNFVTDFVLSAEEGSIGKGYCEFVGRTEDSSRVCRNYSMVLNDFMVGLVKQLPCPPSECTVFQNIKPPKCVPSKSFCDIDIQSDSCISKPERDLFCLQVPDELSESDCVDDSSASPDEIQPGWVVAENSLGNRYCVPSNPVILSPITGIDSSPGDVAEECEYNFCHRQCENNSPAEIENCHFNCDLDFGEIIDCTDGNSPYFSIQCCNSIKARMASKLSYQAVSSSSASLSNLSTGKISSVPVILDVAACLCRDNNNFDDIGYAYEESKLACNGTCSPGFIKDISGICICPEGQKKDPLTGSCISSTLLGTQCKSPLISNSGGTPSCKCPDSLQYSYLDTCVAACPALLTPQKSSTGLLTCLCSDSSSPDSNGKCSAAQHTCAADEVSNSSNLCKCAGAATKNSNGICQCPSGQTYSASGCTTGSSPRTPTALTAAYSQTYGTILLTWTDNADNETVFSVYRRNYGVSTWTLLTESLSTNTTTYTDNGITSGTSYEYRVVACNANGCSEDSKIVTVTAGSTTYCSPSQASTSSNPCTCASGATVNSNGYCQCTNGQTYAASGCPTPTCTNSQVSTSSNPCNCAGDAMAGSDGTCQCPSGSGPYSSNGCFRAHNCEPGEAYSNLNPCTCTGSATLGSDSTCQCPSGQTYTVASGCTGAANQITLNSVTINGSSVTVNYNKNFSSCVNLVTIHHVAVHSDASVFCGNSSTSPLISKFNSSFQSNLDVKLCNSDLTVCSSVVTTTGTPNCASGQVSTSTNSCTCAGSSYQSSNGCSCNYGNTYDQVNGCICGIGQYDYYNTCVCPTNATKVNGVCVCSDGSNAPVAGCP